MTAEEYLEQIPKIDTMLINKRKDYKRYKDIADGCGGGFSVSERVQTTRNLHRGEDAIIEYISIEREIKELEKKRSGIIATLEKLPHNEYKILYAIYVDGYKLKETPYIFKPSMSYSWVKKKKADGLKLVQEFLNEKEG